MKKIGLIVLALVVALGALGAGYAAWTDALTITGTVNTGYVEIGIREMGNDMGTGNGVAAIVYENVGAEIKDLNQTGENTGYYKGISYTVNNAYPDFADEFSFDVKNIGTIPVKISSINFETTGNYDFANNILLTSFNGFNISLLGITLDEAIENEFWINLIISIVPGNWRDLQSGDVNSIDLGFKLTDKTGNRLPEYDSFSFTTTVNAVQYVPSH